MKRLLLTTVAVLAFASPVLANDFQADSFSQPNGFQDVTISNPVNLTVRAGEIDLHSNTQGDLLVWCLDLMDLLVTPYDFKVNTFTAGDSRPGVPSLNASQVRQIASLMLRGLTLGGTDAGDDDAATQLAIWKVEYGVAFASNASGALLNRMNLELADSAAGGSIDCPGCTLTVLTDAINAPNQALGFAVVPTPAPIVGAGLPGLLAGVLSLWGFAKRRRALHA
jgi:hypothetical protein